jgi:hypothetical protein
VRVFETAPAPLFRARALSRTQRRRAASEVSLVCHWAIKQGKKMLMANASAASSVQVFSLGFGFRLF